MLHKCEEGTRSLLEENLSTLTSKLEAIEDNRECEARFRDAIEKLDIIAGENLNLKGGVDKSWITYECIAWQSWAEVNFLQDIVILKTNQLEACEADVPVPKW